MTRNKKEQLIELFGWVDEQFENVLPRATVGAFKILSMYPESHLWKDEKGKDIKVTLEIIEEIYRELYKNYVKWLPKAVQERGTKDRFFDGKSMKRGLEIGGYYDPKEKCAFLGLSVMTEFFPFDDEDEVE